MEQVAIECRNIKKHYGEKETLILALRGINLKIELGKLTLLVGPSGSGKTTLLSVMTAILTPDEGELLLMGRNILEMDSTERAEFCRNTLGVVFQSLYLIPTLTVAENISLPLLIGDVPTHIALEKAKEVLNKFHLADRHNVSPDILSKGQQQKIAIARAIITDSKIIICDEPTSALDQVSGNDVMSLLKDLAINSGKAVLVVTHDHRIFSFADRIIYMSDGQITEGEENA